MIVLVARGQHFGHDLGLDERSQGISNASLYRISPRIFLDGSGLGIEPRRGILFAPELGKGVSSREGWKFAE